MDKLTQPEIETLRSVNNSEDGPDVEGLKRLEARGLVRSVGGGWIITSEGVAALFAVGDIA